MSAAGYFVDVLLPLSLEGTYTYHCTAEEYRRLAKGMRVAVIFGKRSIQTGLVYRKHREAPPFETKPILQIIDDEPVINDKAWQLYKFMAFYYLTSLGRVLRMALPAPFLLQGEHIVMPAGKELPPESALPEEARRLLAQLSPESGTEIRQLLEKASNKSKTLKLIHWLADNGWLHLQAKVSERYRPRYKTFVDLADEAQAETLLRDEQTRARKQRELLLYFFQHYLPARRPVPKEKLREKFSAAVFKALIDKGVLRELKVPVDRQVFDDPTQALPQLSDKQQQAFEAIQSALAQGKPALLHGVTASGKTEIYLRLIDKYLARGKQVLYLLPEIALTAQMIARVRERFGNRVAVYHSRYSLNERYEIWKNVLHGRSEAQLVIGTRSAIFLPFAGLGLVVVDEEHDESYKEHFHQPMYHGRDMALMLGRIHGAGVVLGSATPSVESYHHARSGKYALVELDEKYFRMERPDIRVLDLREAYKQGKMKASFSKDTLDAIRRTVDDGFQVMVFINRRGYAPVVTCKNCGHTPHCPHCSVALTYHKSDGRLHCHYCGYKMPMPARCPACGSPDLEVLGKGTQKIVSELEEIFPDYRIARMDADTVRSRRALENLIEKFQRGDIDILVGTQMLTKGLDFSGLQLAVIVSADSLLAHPDFRANERAFQLMTQVAGRTGRRHRRGQVLIQAYEAGHPVLEWVRRADYRAFFEHEIRQREMFKYPPLHKLVLFELQARNPENLNRAAEWLAQVLRHYFSMVLGPSEPLVYKIKNYFRLEILIKFHRDRSDKVQRETLRRIIRHYESVAAFRSVRLKVNVDP